MPNGQPIYRYKISSSEYASLQQSLANYGEHTPKWDACFVLFACEWWRRNYEGGHWTWDPIFNDIGGVDDIYPARRNEIVENGCQFWKRPIYRTRQSQRFLGTIVVESGIPAKLLVDTHYIAELIKRAYNELGAISSMEEQYLDFIEAEAKYIRVPTTLQKDPFYALIGDVVQSLADLQVKHSLSVQEEPVRYLDKMDSDWRDTFPIRVNSDTAKAFIDNLLSDVAKTPPPASFIARIDYTLERIAGDWFFKSYLSLTKGIHRFDQMGLTEEEYVCLSNKLELYCANDQTEFKVGYVFKIPKKKSIKIDELPEMGLCNNALQKQYWTLFLVDPQNGETYDVPLSNVDLSLAGEPLVFAIQDTRWRLIGSGTVRTKAEVVRILFNDEGQIDCQEYQEVGQLQEEKKVIEIHTTCSITLDSNQFQISPGSEDQLFRYEFRPEDNARRFYLLPRLNKNLFIGVPKVYRINSESGRFSRVLSGLEYYNNGEWKALGNETFGRIRIRLKEGAETNFVKTISVLPPDFSIQFQTGQGTGLDIVSDANLTVRIKSDIPSSIQEKGNSNKSVIFDTTRFGDEELPETCQLILQKPGLYKSVTVTVPFPRKKSAFYDAADNRIAENAHLYVNNVFGARLSLSNPSDTIQKYRLVFTLRNAPEVSVRPLSRVIKLEPLQHRSIPLITFQHQWDRLFSLTDSIDAYVELRAENHRIRVSQFPNIRPTRIGEYISMEGDSPEKEMSVCVLRLDVPFKKEEITVLPHSPENNAWEFPKKKGVWLVFPASNSPQSFRPRAFKIDMEEEVVSEEQAFDQMFQTSVLSHQDRKDMLASIYQQMATDLDHPDWNRLIYLFDATKHLPLSTFDNWTALEDCTDALLAGFFMFRAEMIERLTEEYSIVWQEYPIKNWVATYNRFVDFVQKKYEDLTDEIVKNKIDLLDDFLGLHAHATILKRQTKQTLTEEIVKILIVYELNGREGRPGLRARHPRDIWPDKFNTILAKKAWRLPDYIKRVLPDRISDSQKGIVYLPFILAAAANGIGGAEIHQDDVVNRFKLQEMIDFDEVWFDSIYNMILGYIWNKKHEET